MKKKLISIVIPVCNEEQNIPLIYRALKDVWAKLPKYDYEFIFVNDGSKDGSGRAVEALAVVDKNIKYMELSRNFGQDIANSAGIDAAKGDAVVMMDADLQHPPEIVPKMVEKWEQGGEVVTGIRTYNHGVGFVRKIGSWFFYKIMQVISDKNLIPGQTDFCLIDRTVADAFTNFSEHRRLTRSLINWLGFRRAFVEFEAPARLHGESNYSHLKLVRQAINSFVSNSLVPLRLAGRLGFIITLFSGLLGLVVFFERYIFGDELGWHVSGSAQLAIINVFLIGIVLMALGIIALYIANIHIEVSGRPLYVVRKQMNIE